MSVLLLIFLSLSGVYADSHSLRYFTTGVTAPGYGLPEFFMVVYVDDQQTEIYTSDTRRLVPVAPWRKKHERPEYWEKMTWIIRDYEAIFRQEVKLWRKRFNQTTGFHFLQVKTSCELKDDGSIVSHEQFRYDGREFMYYDTPTGSYIPTMAEAEVITQKWNKEDVGILKRTKNFLENDCIERLKRFIEYGREDLERRVRPGVKVTGRESSGVTKLHCLVYGFHPRAVDVKWMKNGIDEIPSYETTHVLPNPDGTYQIRVAVEVIQQEGDSYSCYVDHSSLEEPLLVKWELIQRREDSSRTVIISLVVIIVLALTLMVVGLRYKKRRDSYTAAGTSNTSSDSDKPVSA